MNAKRLFRKTGCYGAAIFIMALVACQGTAVLAKPASIKTAPGTGFAMEDAVINVANTVGKAVVSISTEHTAKVGPGVKFYFRGPSGGTSPEEDELLRRFFDQFFGGAPEREYRQMGLGSGVIVDSKGYILTNEHVISGADKIKVTLPDGREFAGEVVGKDTRSDLAIVKINAQNLPAVILGNSDNLKIGEWVVAIGNPFGFAMPNPEPTVTVGVISASHRSLGRIASVDRDYNNLIQTDAAINPGNSGGPLVNLKGEVIGINVAIISSTGGYQGIGFAIPINNAKKIMASLKEGKKILYGWLGVTVQDLTDDLAQQFGLSEAKGVLIADVMDNSPAQKAGLQAGDIIIELDNQTINNVREVLDIVSSLEVGKTIDIEIMRDKKKISLEATIGERPEAPENITYAPKESNVKWRGLTVQELDPATEGVVIVNVESMSPADEAGLMPADVIVEINKQPIRNLADYNKVTGTINKESVLARTLRGYFVIKGGK